MFSILKKKKATVCRRFVLIVVVKHLLKKAKSMNYHDLIWTGKFYLVIVFVIIAYCCYRIIGKKSKANQFLEDFTVGLLLMTFKEMFIS